MNFNDLSNNNLSIEYSYDSGNTWQNYNSEFNIASNIKYNYKKLQFRSFDNSGNKSLTLYNLFTVTKLSDNTNNNTTKNTNNNTTKNTNNLRKSNILLYRGLITLKSQKLKKGRQYRKGNTTNGQFNSPSFGSASS